MVCVKRYCYSDSEFWAPNSLCHALRHMQGKAIVGLRLVGVVQVCKQQAIEICMACDSL